MTARTTNRSLAIAAAVVIVAAGAAFGLGRSRHEDVAGSASTVPLTGPDAAAARLAALRAEAADPRLERVQWRLTEVIQNGEKQPVDPAFAFAPVTLSFGSSGFSGYDTCSPYGGAVQIGADSMRITGVDRGSSTCGGATLPYTVDPLWPMRTTLETRGTVAWRLVGSTGLVITRSHAPTLIFVRDTRQRPSTFFAPVGKLDQLPWVPESITVRGVAERVVQNRLADGALTFDGKGRFTIADGCNDMGGSALVGPSTMTLTLGATSAVGCGGFGRVGDIDRAGAVEALIATNPTTLSWKLRETVLTLEDTRGSVLVLRPPRLGWPEWSPTQVGSGTIGSLAYRLGVLVDTHDFDPSLTGRPKKAPIETTTVTLVMQTLDTRGRLGSVNGIEGGTSYKLTPLALQVAALDSSHHVVLGIVAPGIVRVQYTPTGGTTIGLTPTTIAGSGGYGWFFAEVPGTGAHLAGFDSNGYEVAQVDQPAKGFDVTR